MKGEQFNIVLKENNVPCRVSKARPTSRPIPIAYLQALRNELDKLLRESIVTPVTEAIQKTEDILASDKVNDCFTL